MIRVHSNDKPSSHLTNDCIAHLFEDDKGRTLCGANRKRWLTKPKSTLGSATLCANCERIAKARGLEIPA